MPNAAQRHRFPRSATRTTARIATAALATSMASCPADPLDHPARLEAEGRATEAGEAYLAAAKADPALLEAWDGAVRVFCRERHDVGRCLATLDYELELLGSVPRHTEALAEALERRARARLAQGLVDAGRSDLARAEQVAPERASVQAAWARALLATGRRHAARARVEAARRLAPELPELEELWQLSATSTPTPGRDPSEPDPPAFGR